MTIIWRAFCEYIREKITDYKGVNVKNWGAFTYEIETTLPNVRSNFDRSKFNSFDEIKAAKNGSHKLRPCFVIDNKFKKILTRFKDKEEVIKPKSQATIYQKGFQMTFCNSVPIAAAW